MPFLAVSFLFIVLGLITPQHLVADTLIPAGSQWRYYKGQSEPSFPLGQWRNVDFVDASWSVGPAPFRYGDGNGGTVLNDMQNNYSTVYLRHAFQIEEVGQIGNPEIAVDYDDGFAVWINGIQVFETNAPQSKAFNAFAGSNHESGAFETFSLPDPSGYLRQGVNVLAVQVFNVNLTSSDMMLNLELSYSTPDLLPPEIVGFDPAEGVLEELTQITVRFTEPVAGVSSSNLLLNGNSALSVSGSDLEYTWFFNPPGFGQVLVVLDPNHNITDLAVPPNRLDPTGPRTSWRYEIVDDLPPHLLSVHPPAGLTLRTLQDVEVRFDEPVTGVDASDLLANGQPAQSVLGGGAGPYRFSFSFQPNGEVTMSWRQDHGIQDLTTSGNAFRESSWAYQLDSTSPKPVILINELLASNQSGLTDEDGENVDWIELFNPSAQTIRLQGWSLSDDPEDPGKWVFPDVSITPNNFLVVYASGKDRADETVPQRLHTNFSLSGGGEYIGLFYPELPRLPADELSDGFPEQRNDVSYGRNENGAFRYFVDPSPRSSNRGQSLDGVTPTPSVSSSRGFYDRPFQLILSHPRPASAVIRYTLNGSEPTLNSGLTYTQPLRIQSSTLFRSAAFEPGRLPSKTITHTYFFGLNNAMQSLPVLSVTTDLRNLFGPTGIMETNPRNTIFRGIAWERPVSAEWFPLNGEEAFQVDCGLRLQGGNYVRDRYNPNSGLPFSKYSFRLYFRGDYGPTHLDYPLFQGLPIRSFDKIVLRAGMNDHSNPFVVDELVRRLHSDMGHVASHGNVVNFFLNGEYQGYYNPTERIDEDFLNAWTGHQGTWDVIAQFGEVREGDTLEWNRMMNTVTRRDQRNLVNYQASMEQFDMVNFVDYLLLNVFAGTGDWPHNNWRAARPRVPGAKWKFYVWDAEWAMGNQNRSVNVNTFTEDLTRSAEITDLYQSLRLSSEFQLLFADRAQRHLFNDGALTTEHASERFQELQTEMNGVLPNMRGLERGWIGPRRRVILQHLAQQGFFRSENAPVFAPHGGRLTNGDPIQITSVLGQIYFTLDGSDPREFGTGSVASSAVPYDGDQGLPLHQSVTLKARTLNGGEWSALSEAVYRVDLPEMPLVFTELMVDPVGGSEFEYLEIWNSGDLPYEVTGLRMSGINYSFVPLTSIPARTRVVLASDKDPEAFARRYPDLEVYGYFGGNLANEGERLQILDAENRVRLSVDYSIESPWPTGTDGTGFSLERQYFDGDASDPTQWRRSARFNGTPGSVSPVLPARIVINEFLIESAPEISGWIEFRNTTGLDVDMRGWSLTSYTDDPIRFDFPSGISIPANGFLTADLGSQSLESGMSLNLHPSPRGGMILLHDSQNQLADGLQYGSQVTGMALGRVMEDWRIVEPTPGEANTALATAHAASLRINEWMVNSPPGEPDWIELHNSHSTAPILLQGYHFRLDAATTPMPWLSVIAPQGFLTVIADEGAGVGHVDFTLAASGGLLELLDPAFQSIDQITIIDYGEGVSAGRLPDGIGSVVPFPKSVSPGQRNYLPSESGVRIEEVMARSFQEPYDWIELHNPGSESIALGGMSVSIDRKSPGEWRFPDGMILESNSYLVLPCDGSRDPSNQPDALNTGQSISSESGAVYLFNERDQLIDSVEFGFQIRDRSMGRRDSGWHLLDRPSPGAPNGPEALLGNARNLKLNEWMAAATDGDDWFEIHNPEPMPVSMGGMFLSDDLSLSGRYRYTIPPLTFIGAKQWLVWNADSNRGVGRHHVDFSLNVEGENLVLSDSFRQIVDEITFGTQSPDITQGRLPDGSEDIQFLDAPTPEAPNDPAQSDTDQDGLPDAWEIEHGLDPANAEDAFVDSDGDGMSNIEEFLAGTDPMDADSRLSIGLAFTDDARLEISFVAVPGKSYEIQVSQASAPVEWVVLDSVGLLLEVPAREMKFSVDANLDASFYRVVLRP